jgi:hypothetical protein
LLWRKQSGFRPTDALRRRLTLSSVDLTRMGFSPLPRVEARRAGIVPAGMKIACSGVARASCKRHCAGHQANGDKPGTKRRKGDWSEPGQRDFLEATDAAGQHKHPLQIFLPSFLVMLFARGWLMHLLQLGQQGDRKRSRVGRCRGHAVFKACP